MARSAMALVVANVIMVAGCSASRPWDVAPQPVANLPERFVVSSSLPGAGFALTPSIGCARRLVDRRDGTRLTLVRSARRGDTPSSYRGDYDVAPAGRYRIGPRELLRVECGTGRPLGKVRR